MGRTVRYTVGASVLSAVALIVSPPLANAGPSGPTIEYLKGWDADRDRSRGAAYFAADEWARSRNQQCTVDDLSKIVSEPQYGRLPGTPVGSPLYLGWVTTIEAICQPPVPGTSPGFVLTS